MRRRPILGIAIVLSILTCSAGAQGLLPTSGGPPVSDVKLREMIDTYIPDYHSTILIFTQCYGGNFLVPFAGRDRTVAMSASVPGALSWYGGFHDDAARAMGPAEGKTSHDIFNAGVAGKDMLETPIIIGDSQSYAPVTEDGEIRSRHVLVYAGAPAVLDANDAENIRQLLAGEPGTTVTVVAGPLPNNAEGADDWQPDYPATAEGLATALAEIGAIMNENEQFVLFVTDHGGSLPVSETFNLAPAGSEGEYHNAALTVTPAEVEFLTSGASELGKAGFLLFLPEGQEAPESDELEITLDFISDIPINMVYEYSLPDTFLSESVSMGHGVYFEVEPEIIAEQVQADGSLAVWLFNRGLQARMEMTLALLMPTLPKEGLGDLLAMFGIGPYSNPTFTGGTGQEALIQFVIGNASLTDPLVMNTFDFEFDMSTIGEELRSKILGFHLYHDVDGDGEISSPDYLIDSVEVLEGTTSYRFEAEHGEVVIQPQEEELFVAGIHFRF